MALVPVETDRPQMRRLTLSFVLKVKFIGRVRSHRHRDTGEPASGAPNGRERGVNPFAAPAIRR